MRRLLVVLASVASLFFAAPAQAYITPNLPPLSGSEPARYTSPFGSDVNDCTSITAPCQTIQRLENVLLPGEVGFVRGGTYAENLIVNVVGTAAQPITIRNYPGEQVIYHAANTGSEPIKIDTPTRFFRLQGLYIEATTSAWTGTGRQMLWVTGTASGAQDIEIRGNVFEGFHPGTTTRHDITPLLAGPASQRVQVIGNLIRHWGPNTGNQRHGIYFQGQNGLVANNVVYSGFHGFGIQVRGESSSQFCNNVTVTGNTVSDWPSTNTAGGRGIYVEDTCRGVRLRNNISTFAVSTQQEIYGLDTSATDPPDGSNRAFTNLVWDTTTPNTGNTSGHNVLSFTDAVPGCYSGACLPGTNTRADPLFADRLNGNFALGDGSPAINTADDSVALAFDFNDQPRCGQADKGALEKQCPPPPPPPPPPTQCADGLDNDGDTLIDFPADPGCVDAADNDELPFNDVSPPSAPGNPSISSPLPSSVTLSWQASTDNVGVAGYRVYRDNVQVADVTTLFALADGLSNPSHLLEVAAYDATNNVSARAPLTINRSWVSGG